MYLTVERFAFQFISALREKSALDFKEKLRSIDILLIDDMQFLTGKTVQQEFCHMLNALLDSARQIVVAADRPPAELEGVDERVRSRLKGGVVVGVSGPDLAMRRHILDTRLKTARDRNPSLDISEPVLDYVARTVTTNGRDLDGALNRLICRADFSDGPITMDIAEFAIADLVGAREPRRIRIEDIQKVVARHYNVSKHDLLSARRTRTIVRAAADCHVPGQDHDAALVSGNRQALWRSRSHDGASRRTENRGNGVRRPDAGAGDRAPEADDPGLTFRPFGKAITAPAGGRDTYPHTNFLRSCFFRAGRHVSRPSPCDSGPAYRLIRHPLFARPKNGLALELGIVPTLRLWTRIGHLTPPGAQRASV